MNIQGSSLFTGNETVLNNPISCNKDENDKVTKSNIINANNTKINSNPIEEKKKQAKKNAMQIMHNAFRGEISIDDELRERKQNIKKQSQIIDENLTQIKNIEAERVSLRDQYHVSEDSQEEKDLELLAKEAEANFKGSTTILTIEERRRLGQIYKSGLTEYQQLSIDMKKTEEPYCIAVNEAKQELQKENAIIRETNLERLKSNPMAKAKKQADALMDAAGKEIMSMLIDEGTEHLDEVQEENKEKAEKIAEKQEEKKQQIEAAKERKKEQEEWLENLSEATIDIPTAAADISDAQQEIEKMMSKMKLIEEDIKGAAFDESL